ncbi:MAG: MBL fold metallo-hydrolase [Nanoarchaeota archaeon]
MNKVSIINTGHLSVPSQEVYSKEALSLLPEPGRKRIKMPVFSFLVQNSDFSVLVDASGTNYEFMPWIIRQYIKTRFKPEPAESISSQLKERGVKKLDFVFTTHLHFDHVSGLEEVVCDFNPHVFISPNEFKQAGKRFKMGYPSRKYFKQLLPKPLPNMEKYGLSTIELSGHSYGDVGLAVSSSRVLIVGDAIEGPLGFVGNPPKIFKKDYTAYQARIEYLRGLSGDFAILSSHDPFLQACDNVLDIVPEIMERQKSFANLS